MTAAATLSTTSRLAASRTPPCRRARSAVTVVNRSSQVSTGTSTTLASASTSARAPRGWAVGAGQAARHPDDHELDLFLTGEGGDAAVVLVAAAPTPDHRER